MKVLVIEEAGWFGAITGLSLSYGSTFERAITTSEKLAHRDGGHNKFLESIYVWIDVTAPRFWWQEADTYRMSTKQSESTMHTIDKRELTNADFETWLSLDQLKSINISLDMYKECKGDPLMEIVMLVRLKNALPEGFLQRRIWVMNYKTLRNIIKQRRTHRLPQWRQFCASVLEQVQHPELLPTLDPPHQDTSQESQDA
jgi:hypothetical protein